MLTELHAKRQISDSISQLESRAIDCGIDLEIFKVDKSITAKRRSNKPQNIVWTGEFCWQFCRRDNNRERVMSNKNQWSFWTQKKTSTETYHNRISSISSFAKLQALSAGNVRQLSVVKLHLLQWDFLSKFPSNICMK